MPWGDAGKVMPKEVVDEEQMPRKHQETRRRWLACCLVGPLVVPGAMLLLKDNVRLANKLGLQRMRTQRLLKRTLFTLVGDEDEASSYNLEALTEDAIRSLEVIEKKHKGFVSYGGGPLRAKLKDIDKSLDLLRLKLETFLASVANHQTLDEEWAALNGRGSEVVRGYSAAIETFDWQQSLLGWGIVVINALAWSLMIKFAVDTYQARSAADAERRALSASVSKLRDAALKEKSSIIVSAIPFA